MKNNEILLGAHTSIAGGVQHAVYEGSDIGATTVQIFTANQRQWKAKPLSQENIDNWHKAVSETGIKNVMSHDSYLINLGSHNPELLEKSRDTFRTEITRCLQLGLSYCNFHPGSAVGATVEECLDRIVESLISVKDLFTDDSSLQLLLETTAGQGTTVGSRFEELAYIVERTKQHVPIGVCIDTCHIFVAGYDLKTKKSVETMLTTFDKIIGLQYLQAFHLNDSLKDVGSRVDRHAPIGKGCIGIECFKTIMQDARLQKLPKYLETPGGPEAWKEEIKLLRSFVDS